MVYGYVKNVCFNNLIVDKLILLNMHYGNYEDALLKLFWIV